MCVGGLDLNPIVYSCSYKGLILGFLSVKNLLYLLIVGGIFFFGWPYIEALLIFLPIPDPKNIKEKITGVFSGMKSQATQKRPNVKSAGYTERFDQAPESLEEDDDDEDVGK